MYFDELLAAEEYKRNELEEFKPLLGEKNIKSFFSSNEDIEKLEQTKNGLKKKLLKYIKLGLIRKTESTGVYEYGDESIASVIYAYCLTTEFLTRKKHIGKMYALVSKYVSPAEIRAGKDEVSKIGCSAKEYVLLCQVTALVRKAFDLPEAMEELTELFQLLFKNIDKDFQHVFNTKHLSMNALINTYSNKSETEKTACVFLAHRYAQELSVYIWTLIHPWIMMLRPIKYQETSIPENRDVRIAYAKYAMGKGVILAKDRPNHEDDSKIAFIIKNYDIANTDVFSEGCYYIHGLQKELLECLDKDLENAIKQRFNSKKNLDVEPHHETSPLRDSSNSLQKQISFMEDKCSRLQNTINEMAIEKEMLQNKFQKELDAITQKYQECLEELKTYHQQDIQAIKEDHAAEIELKDRRIMIIGGHDRWHQIIKSVYPNWILVNDEKYLPTELYKVDGIFFFTKYMSHSLYKRYVTQCRSHNIPFYYLNSLNLQAVEEQIKATLQKEEVFES